MIKLSRMILLVWLWLFYFKVAVLALKLYFSPLEILAVAGSNGLPPVIHRLLLSAKLTQNFWQLLNTSSIDFNSFLDETCFIVEGSPAWPCDSPLAKKLETPTCLYFTGLEDIDLAFDFVSSSSTRPILDLKLFGTEESYKDNAWLDFLITKAAWGFGPIMPWGNWCTIGPPSRPFHRDIWLLIDSSCLNCMSQAKKTWVPALELVSQQDQWSILGTADPDYRQACFRFLIFSHLEAHIRHSKSLDYKLTKIDVIKKRLVRNLSKLTTFQPSRWEACFLSMIKSEWSLYNLQNILIPLLDHSDLEPSFKLRMSLLYLERCWKADDRTLKLLTEIILNKQANPLHISNFLETLIITCPENAVRAFEAVLKHTPKKTNRDYLGYSVWEILFRPIKGYKRPRLLFELVPLGIRSRVALRNIRFVHYKEVLNLIANPGESLPSSNFWLGSPHSLSDMHCSLNMQQLHSMTIVKGPDDLSKVSFGMKSVRPAHVFSHPFRPITKQKEACATLRSTHISTLNLLDNTSYSKAYERCFSGDARFYNCKMVMLSYVVLYFSWGCRIEQTLLPTLKQFVKLYGPLDPAGIITNWMTHEELYTLILQH